MTNFILSVPACIRGDYLSSEKVIGKNELNENQYE